MPRVFVMGFVGCGNLGDEAILAGTLHSLRQAGITEPLVYSWRPDQTTAEHNVSSLPVLPGIRGLRDFGNYLSKGDLFLLGGGSLLQDGEARIVPFWLSRALVAKLKGCTVVYHAQGVGPLNGRFARSLVRTLVPLTADVFTVRDSDSQGLLSGTIKAQLVGDPALLLPELNINKDRGKVVVAIRHTRTGPQIDELIASLRLLSSSNSVQFVFLPMHTPDDIELCRQVAKSTNGTVYEGPYTVPAVRTLLASAELVIAMRLHAAILSAGVGTPSVGLSYDPKVQSFYSALGLPEFVLLWDSRFTANDAGRLFITAYQNRVELAEITKQQTSIMQGKAKNSIPVALGKWKG